MIKWHYVNSSALICFDPGLKKSQYQHSAWFRATDMAFFPVHPQSRVHAIDTPWSLTPTLYAMPDQCGTESFDSVIETVAKQYEAHCEKNNLVPYVCWSGGIDSTTILVALLKTASSNFLKKLVVLLDQNSTKENPYFYHRFILGQLQEQDINGIDINSQNYNRIALVDGETGNQCMGSTPIHFLAQAGRYDELAMTWRQADQRRYFDHADSDVVDLVLSMINHSIPLAPCELTTVYDVLWWWNFNFKFDEAAKRKILAYTQNLNGAQTQHFVAHSLIRFYSDPLMQQWSLGSIKQRHQCLNKDSRYFQKQYIFDFDSNTLWYYNKQEEMSQSNYYKKSLWHSSMFGLDEHWNKHSFANSEQRHQLGQLLQRLQ